MGKKPPTPADGAKKKRGYTMGPASRAQRRGAARKHGRRASTAARAVLPACKPDQCPIGDWAGCNVRLAARERRLEMDSCPVVLVSSPEVKARYLEAIEKRDPKGLRDGAATTMAAFEETLHAELEKLKTEGFTQTEFIPEGGAVERKNPRLDGAIQVATLLGHTAKQQGITAEAQTNAKAADAMGGFVAAIRGSKSLGGGLAPDVDEDEP